MVEEACKVKKISLRGATVAIQGFGNVGSAVARLFAEKKAKIVAISDSRGGVHNPRGIDPLRAMRYKERSGTVVGMPGASRISNEELLALKCDILIPAALENVITLHNADQIKAKIVAEAANGPTTPHADEVLSRKGVFVLPDILANAGGVTVSYFEWAQDLQGFFWQAQEVNSKLEFVMQPRVQRRVRDHAQVSTSTRAPLRTFSPSAASRKPRWSADCSRRSNHGSAAYRVSLRLFVTTLTHSLKNSSCARAITRVHFDLPARADVWRSRSTFSVGVFWRGGREELSNHVNSLRRSC